VVRFKDGVYGIDEKCGSVLGEDNERSHTHPAVTEADEPHESAGRAKRTGLSSTAWAMIAEMHQRKCTALKIHQELKRVCVLLVLLTFFFTARN